MNRVRTASLCLFLWMTKRTLTHYKTYTCLLYFVPFHILFVTQVLVFTKNLPMDKTRTIPYGKKNIALFFFWIVRFRDLSYLKKKNITMVP